MFDFLPKNDRKILEEAKRSGGFIQHDYRNPEHLKFVMERFGGEEHIRTEYSKVYQAIQNGKKKKLIKKDEIRNDYAQGFTDKMSVEKVEQENSNIKVKCCADYKEEKPIVSIQTEIYDQEAGVYLDGSDSEACNILSMSTEDICDISAFVNRKKDIQILVASHFFYVEEDEYGDPYLASSTEFYDGVKILSDDFVEEFKVLDPIIGKRKPTKRDYILVVYNRETQVGEDYDYNSGKKVEYSKLPIDIPVGARVKVNQYHRILGLYEDYGARLYIKDLSGGVAEYYGTPSITKIDERTIQWDYPSDWKRILDVTGLQVKVETRIYCRVCLEISNEKGQFGRPVWFTFQSIPINGTLENSSDITINNHPIIRFMWGCLGKNSMVRMADNSEKKISEIKPGEFVAVFRDGERSMEEVVDICTSIDPEDEMINLTLEDGSELLITEDHPVQTERGVICAGNILLRDRIMTEKGALGIEYLYYQKYNDISYNLQLKNSGMISCCGMIVGDYEMQQHGGEEDEKEKKVFSEASIDLQEEFRRLLKNRERKNRENRG